MDATAAITSLASKCSQLVKDAFASVFFFLFCSEIARENPHLIGVLGKKISSKVDLDWSIFLFGWEFQKLFPHSKVQLN